MGTTLPKGYKPGVTRVSDIVDFEYSFGGDGKERYYKWIEENEQHIIGGTQEKGTYNSKTKRTERSLLASNIIKRWSNKTRRFLLEKLYVKEACDVGTFIHLQMEKYINLLPLDIDNPLFKLHEDEIEHSCRHIDSIIEERNNILETEVVVCDSQNRWQGTIDMLEIDEDNKTVYLTDHKTFGIAKKKFDLPDTSYVKNSKGIYNFKKPTDKLKKVALQLSLYAECRRQKGYKIGGIYCNVLHQSGTYSYRLFEEDHRQKSPLIRLWSSEELDDLVSRKERGEEDLPLNYKYVTLSDMKIKIQTPTATPYEFVSGEIDFYKEGDKTSAEKMKRIDELVTSIAYTKTVVNNGPKT